MLEQGETRVVAFSCNSTKANFKVRQIALIAQAAPIHGRSMLRIPHEAPPPDSGATRERVAREKKYPGLAKGPKPRQPWAWPKGSNAEKEARAALASLNE